MKYSVAGYGTHTPNYWKITKFGGGDTSKCVGSNQWCYVCEPPSEHTNVSAFSIFPEPKGQAGWERAKQFVSEGASAAGLPPPVWHEDMVPGEAYPDPSTGVSSTVPGSGLFHSIGRDPYEDFVYLARDLSASGVDLDYEEMWHADTFKEVAPNGRAATGPWLLHQTTYKYAAILQDIRGAVHVIDPSLKVSTATAAAGAWAGKWWGGNLKGLWLQLHQHFAAAAEDVELNVMTYDLSKDAQYHECPDPADCTLDQQVAFYMQTYATAGMRQRVNVGYEIGTPAYPSPVEDGANQLPLTTTALETIASGTQTQFGGGFFWDMFKQPVVAGQASATQTAQAICRAVRGAADPRCRGTIPSIPTSSSSSSSSSSSTLSRHHHRSSATAGRRWPSAATRALPEVADARRRRLPPPPPADGAAA
jgi:hypothetical protein